MKLTWAALTSGVALCASLSSSPVLAADHTDGAGVKMDAASDINDVYAWMSPDGTKVYLAMTVFPIADTSSKFSDTTKYVFHLNSAAMYGGAATEVRIICTFTTAQVASCWVTRGAEVLDYVTGDASATAGITSMSGDTKVFAGLRDDPFFFNLTGFREVATQVGTAAPTLQFDPAGCPTLDMATATALVGQLSTAVGGGAAVNFFATLNTLAIVISVDKDLVTPGGAILGVWGSTHQ